LLGGVNRLRFLSFLLLSAFVAPLHAETKMLSATKQVEQADAARVRATIAGDATKLGDLLSDDLIYGHNDGRAQTKAEFIQAVASNQVKYQAFDYLDTKLTEVAPGVVTMTGRVRLKASRGDVRVEFTLRFLAVWRSESDQWRLYAYQSARLPDAPASPAAPAKTSP
jgi:ketosteroid isomerase-like protein